MKVSQLIFDHLGEAISVLVCAGVPPKTIQVADPVWFMQFLDQATDPDAIASSIVRAESHIERSAAAEVGYDRGMLPKPKRKRGRPRKEDSVPDPWAATRKARGGWVKNHLVNESDLDIVRMAMVTKDERLTKLQHDILKWRLPVKGEALTVKQVAFRAGIKREGVVRQMRLAFKALGLSITRRARSKNGHGARVKTSGTTRAAKPRVLEQANSPRLRPLLVRMALDQNGDRYGISRREYERLALRFVVDPGGSISRSPFSNAQIAEQMGERDPSGTKVSLALNQTLERLLRNTDKRRVHGFTGAKLVEQGAARS